MIRRALIFTSVLSVAAGLGWWIAQSDSALLSPITADEHAASVAVRTLSQQDQSAPILSGKNPDSRTEPASNATKVNTADERYRVLADQVANGGDELPTQLVRSLEDPETSNRLFALQSAEGLLADDALFVLTEAAMNDRDEVRKQCWAALANYTIEERQQVLAEIVARGPDASLEEALRQVGDQLDKAMLTTLLRSAPMTSDPRQMRIVRAGQAWLDAGGAAVPRWRNLQEAIGWWSSHERHYDEQLMWVTD
ncbi:MAG: hypothetical protein JNJ83_21330 [Verrucomicrobiaceae bacterium]|nr:hypothetical protein [Verrucomicrobiaceae bacterium]